MSDAYKLNDDFTRAMTAFAAGTYDESVRILSAIIEADAGHTRALSARGAAHLKADDIEAAIADFDRALEIDPAYTRARHLRGLAREKLGDFDGALTDFDRAVEQAPDYGAAYFSRANLHAKMGHEDEATDDFETVAGLTHMNIEAFTNENNVWRSLHMRVEQEMMETELNR